jgi:hypothetical protein
MDDINDLIRSEADFLKEIEKQKFAEDLLVAWGLIELRADESILMAYSLSSQDARAEPLMNMNLDRKLQLFMKMKVLSKIDYKILNKLQIKRNNLFHAGGLFIPNMTDDEKSEIIKMAKDSVNIMTKLTAMLRERQGERRVYLQ